MIKETDVKNQVYEIKYEGYLMDSENVLLHYGYSEWQDVSEKKMRKLKNCCKIEVTIPQGTELNFCFRDENERWDNNFENNYYYKHGITSDYEFVEISPKTEKKSTTTKSTTSKTKSTAASTKTAKTSSKTTTKTCAKTKTVKEK